MKRAANMSFPPFDLERSLRALLAEKAPASLLPAVLARVGLGDTYWKLESPIGSVFVARSKAGISLVSRAASAREFERAFQRHFGRRVTAEKSPPPASVRALIRKPTRSKSADLRFDLRGLSEFERAVLLKAREIPPGEVRPYSWIAREIGRPGAVRAAGSALAKNPIPLLIPCHRVVRSDGRIGNYAMGGRPAKRRLLEVEGAEPETLERLASQGIRYLGNEAGRYYCYPTCGGLKSLVRDNTIRFGSAREAVAAGYQPCGDCRPAIAA